MRFLPAPNAAESSATAGSCPAIFMHGDEIIYIQKQGQNAQESEKACAPGSGTESRREAGLFCHQTVLYFSWLLLLPCSQQEGRPCSAVLGGTRQEKLCWPCVHEPRVVPASLCTLQDAVVVRTAADLIWETATLSAVWASSAGKTGRTGMFLSSKRDIGNIPGKT